VACGANEYIIQSNDPSKKCTPCPVSVTCPNGGPPIQTTSVQLFMSIDGLSSDQIKNDPEIAYALILALAQTTGVDPSLISLTVSCDASGSGCTSLLRNSFHQQPGVDPGGAKTLQAFTTAALLAPGGARRASGATVKFTLFAPAVESVEAISDAMQNPEFAASLASAVTTKMAAQNFTVAVAVSSTATSLVIDSTKDQYKGWTYNLDKSSGKSHLVGCPVGSLVVNATVATQTCFLCPVNVNPSWSTPQCQPLSALNLNPSISTTQSQPLMVNPSMSTPQCPQCQPLNVNPSMSTPQCPQCQPLNVNPSMSTPQCLQSQPFNVIPSMSTPHCQPQVH
jgi:hypothetical protein